MRFPKLFKGSAYPELDEGLRKRLSNFVRSKKIVLVHVRLLHLNDPSDIYVLYLFSKKTKTVRGIKLDAEARTVEKVIEHGRTFANYYSRKGKVRVRTVSYNFTTKSRWVY